MKLLSILLVTFASTLALAMPTVNDTATYDITYTQGTQTATMVQEIVITAYDQTTKLYTLKTTQIANGQTQVKESQSAADKLVSDGAVDQIMSGCEAKGGKVGPVTVPAGTINSCALPINENGTTGTITIASVPFGIVKMDLVSSGITVSYVLKAYKKGE